MFAIGDYVINQKTKCAGKVIGYGHQIINDVYMPTLLVLVAKSSNLEKRMFIEEDLHSTWTQGQEVNNLTSEMSAVGGIVKN